MQNADQGGPPPPFQAIAGGGGGGAPQGPLGLVDMLGQLVALNQQLVNANAQMGQNFQQLEANVNLLNQFIQQPPVAPVVNVAAPAIPAAAPRPHIPDIPRYDGEQGEAFETFIAQCKNVFQIAPAQFPNLRRSIAFVMGNLGGRAADWHVANQARIMAQQLPWANWDAFETELRTTFGDPNRVANAGLKIEAMRGNQYQSAADFLADFRRYAPICEYNEGVLRNKLQERVKPAWLNYYLPLKATSPNLQQDYLNVLQAEATAQIATRAREMANPGQAQNNQRGRGRGQTQGYQPQNVPFQRTNVNVPFVPQPPAAAADPDAMDLDAGRRRGGGRGALQFRAGVTCYNCGTEGHYRNQCPYQVNQQGQGRGRGGQQYQQPRGRGNMRQANAAMIPQGQGPPPAIAAAGPPPPVPFNMAELQAMIAALNANQEQGEAQENGGETGEQQQLNFNA